MSDDPFAPPPDPRTRVPLSVEKVLIAAAMATMALITAGNVVSRYVTNISLAFTEEYSVMLMVVVALLGTALATAAGRHVPSAPWWTARLTRARPNLERWRWWC